MDDMALVVIRHTLQIHGNAVKNALDVYIHHPFMIPNRSFDLNGDNNYRQLKYPQQI